MAGISFQIYADEQPLRRYLKRIENRLESPRPVLASIGEYMLRRTEERFFAQKDPQGKAWKKLSPVTLKTKKHTKILTESGNLRGRIVYRLEPGAVVIGTNVVYGAIHQLGGTIRKNVQVRIHWRIMNRAFGRPIPARHVMVDSHERKMDLTIPARPFLGVNDEDRQEFENILIDYLTDR
ncbi:phage virion morphogenesis protein [Desulfosarcina ovata]|nr:phage virion morphogenesis protein [Desulfosarcina ovata]